MRISMTFVLMLAACGGDDDTTPPVDAGPGVTDSGRMDAGPAPDPDAGPPDAGAIDAGPDCTAGEVCTTNPNPACRMGVTDCATGAETCIDGTPLEDGTTCTTGLCAGGDCLGTTDITTDVNLTTDSTTGGTCGDANQHAAMAFPDATSVTLSADPAAGCLAAGDEVLLINLQGQPMATDNVGNHELLTIDSIMGATVTFTTPKMRSYGSSAGSDADIGTGPTDQRVVLIRVPRYGTLTVSAGATLSAAAFDGQMGGVVALRAGSLTVDGTISASRLGYRPGRWSRDTSCTDNLATENGESISGPSTQSTMRNTGGPGGLSAVTGVSFNSNSPLNPSAGHSAAGEPGVNPNGRTLGEPGAAYGVNDGTQLTMGSGSAGGLTCSGVAMPTMLADVFATGSGGIILLLVGDLTVNGTGAITASAADEGRDVSSSGGYVSIVGNDLTLGTDLVSALGGVGMGVNGPTLGVSNNSSPGYIVLQASGTISGTTTPVANVLP